MLLTVINLVENPLLEKKTFLTVLQVMLEGTVDFGT